MSWIILALTLGASITSIIHGVFMLFGSLSITGGALIGIPSTLLASLPIIAAVFALIGGIIAFNQSKWGALFLFTAAGICAPARDTWLYAGLYFFAALFCFFLKKKDNYYKDDIYGDDEYEELDSEPASTRTYPPQREPEESDFYYEDQIAPSQNINLDTLEENNYSSVINDFQAPPPPPVNNPEPLKIRTRPNKTCPACGMNVAREAKFCSHCGSKLFVAPEVLAESENNNTVSGILGSPSPELGRDDSGFEFEPVSQSQNQNQDIYPQQEDIFQPEGDNSIDNINMNDGDEMSFNLAQTVPNYRVSVNNNNAGRQDAYYRAQGQGRGSRSGSGRSRGQAMTDDAALSYQEFSKSQFSKRGKKRKRSPFRRVLSILLLIGAVGGALYFLLGLRKLPPGDLPPIAKPEVVRVNGNNNNEPRPPARDINNDTSIVEPVDVVVTENILPNFTPDRNPTTGVITGNGVNMRADHSTGSARVTRLSSGTRVEVIDSWTGRSGNLNGTWFNVRTNGKEGWVYGQYMQALGSGLPAGYSNGLIKSFGNNRAQLIETLGQPSKSSSNSLEWQGLTATLRGDDISRIRLSSSKHELQNGLKVGMSQTALLQILGYPSSVNNRTMNYNEGSSTGVSVGLDRSNLITSITVNEIR